ncbi:hypothetical protein GIB67_031127, partial [Kingdonia uniflora]
MYTMNEKVHPTASNRRKKEGDLLTYKRKRKTIDLSIVVPPNIVDTANKGVNKPVPPIESAQATLGAQAESAQVAEGATSNENIGPSDKSLLRSFKFHRARSIALGQEKLPIRVHHHQFTWDLTKEPQAVFENNLIEDLNVFKSLKAGGTGNSLSLRKLKKYYTFKLEKVLSDDTTAAAKKKKGLTARFVARAYMMYVLGSFLFPTKRAQMSAHDDDVGIHQRKKASANEHGDTPVHQSEVVAEQYDTSVNIGVQKFGDKRYKFRGRAKCKVSKSLKAVNALLMEQIDLHLPPTTPFVVLQSHQPVPDATLAKKYDDLLAAHENVKKKLIAKKDF